MGSVSFVLWMEGAMMSQYVEKLVHIVTLSLSLMLSSSLSQARISSSPSLSHISSLRNISLYPPCAYDEDCVSDHKCMQYMCYPWKTSTGFRWCSKDDDCENLPVTDGGDGSNGLCFRHPDKDNIHFGICLKKIETKKCYNHDDCPRHLRCTNSYCGDMHYYEALKQRECEDDSICEQLLTGEMCCYDLSAAEQWSMGELRWIKKCCNNPSGHPVLRPTRNLSQQQLKKLDKGIGALAPLFMDSVICEGLDYSMMTQLESCQLYTTTTTTTDRTNKLHHTSGATPGVRNVKLYPGVGLFTLIFSYIVHLCIAK